MFRGASRLFSERLCQPVVDTRETTFVFILTILTFAQKSIFVDSSPTFDVTSCWRSERVSKRVICNDAARHSFWRHFDLFHLTSDARRMFNCLCRARLNRYSSWQVLRTKKTATEVRRETFRVCARLYISFRTHLHREFACLLFPFSRISCISW